VTRDLQWDRVLVVGAGRSGLGAVAALQGRAREVYVFDESAKVREGLAARIDGIVVIGDESVLGEEFSLVVVSPGVPIGRYGLTPIPGRVVGELELGWWIARAPILAVTGTNGKTTVATLAASMLGARAVLCGNAGTSFAGVASTSAGVFVVEASSFQLAWAPTFAPHVAAFVNFSPDHLDWHGSLEAYFAAKASMFARLEEGAVAILNEDDPAVRSVDVARGALVRTVSVGPEADYCVIDGHLVSRASGLRVATSALKRSKPTDLVDALMAFALAESAGAADDAIVRALVEFRGLRHRQEVVGEVQGVRFVNDSKATTPEAAAAAIRGYPRVVLIAGGRSKQVPLAPVTDLASHLVAVIAIGENQEEVVRACRARGIRVARAGSMREAVDAASALARAGDTVLLAPAAASYDWYRSYEERGDDFVRVVRALPGFEEVGE